MVTSWSTKLKKSTLRNIFKIDHCNSPSFSNESTSLMNESYYQTNKDL